MSRLEKLRSLEQVAQESLLEAPADKRSPIISQLRGILAEIDELESASGGEVETNGLIDFQAALADRQQPASKGPRSSSRR